MSNKGKQLIPIAYNSHDCESFYKCPFCGSTAKVKKAYPDECVGMCFARYYVACTSDECGAEMGISEYSPEDAIEKWNKRI